MTTRDGDAIDEARHESAVEMLRERNALRQRVAELEAERELALCRWRLDNEAWNRCIEDLMRKEERLRLAEAVVEAARAITAGWECDCGTCDDCRLQQRLTKYDNAATKPASGGS
jgi:hypothetical protein